MLALSIGLVVVSAFYISSFLVLLGTAIIFWVVILLYITPAKHVPLTLLNTSVNANSGNIERILAELSSPHYGLTNLTVNKKKLRNAAFTLSIYYL
jgi:hypothetical protein